MSGNLKKKREHEHINIPFYRDLMKQAAVVVVIVW